MEVGVQELKAKLSEYLDYAALGHSITVTDQGLPIAMLVGIHKESAMQRGINEGWIKPAQLARLEPVSRHIARRSVLEALDEDRG